MRRRSRSPRSYLALQQKTVDGQENPLPTIMAKKFYEVQSHIMLTGHITESLLTIVGSYVAKLDGRREEDLRGGADAKLRRRRPSRSASPSRSPPTSSRKLGKTVVEVGLARRSAEAALPLHNDGSGGWSQAEYDALQAIK